MWQPDFINLCSNPGYGYFATCFGRFFCAQEDALVEMCVWVDIFVDKCFKTVAKIQGMKWFIYAKTSDKYI